MMTYSSVLSRVMLVLFVSLLGAIPAYSWDFDSDLKDRIQSMDLCIDNVYDSEVKKDLRVYLRLSHSNTEKILERMVQYFPIIEPILIKNGLPVDLKYMVVVESEIDPYAESSHGALGLWQLMPETARELGLRVDDYIDERRDPIKSTEAASKHLSYLYNRLENWELTLAAYNGGLYRIKRAIRKYGNSFSTIKNALPKETAKYPSSYIAAAYLCQHFDKHFFTIPKINPDIQITDHIQVFEHTSFVDISKKTGLPLYIVYQLNPMYKKDYLPKSEAGMTLTLPSRLISQWPHLQFKEYSQADIIFYNPQLYYTTTMIYADVNQSIHTVADQVEVDPYLIKYWNHLDRNTLERPRSLVIISAK